VLNCRQEEVIKAWDLPPALVDIRKMNWFGSELKSSTVC
jgi:hypothetical protein